MTAPTSEDWSGACATSSDQINAADLVGAPLTGRITRIVVRPRVKRRGKTDRDQPVDIHLDHDREALAGRVWRPCRTVLRLLREMLGENPVFYVSQWVTLYCDPTVRSPAGVAVGGVRISHASGIGGGTYTVPAGQGGATVSWEVKRLEPPAAPTLEDILTAAGLTVADLDAHRAALPTPKAPISTLTDAERSALATYYTGRPDALPRR